MNLDAAATVTPQPRASPHPRGTARPCASPPVREDPRGPGHLRRPRGTASSSIPRGAASAGPQPRAAPPPCTSSAGPPRPRATPARPQWPGNSFPLLCCSAALLFSSSPVFLTYFACACSALCLWSSTGRFSSAWLFPPFKINSYVSGYVLNFLLSWYI